MRLLVAGIILGAGVSLAALASGFDRATPVLAALMVVYVGAGPFVVVRRLLQHERVTFATIAGALCVYLLVGQFYAVLYPLIALVMRRPFFVETHAGSPVDYLYFSFVTMTTVGYGDLTAGTNVGKIAAVTEAVIGQLYLVTVVALVVGNVGRPLRGSRPERPE